MSTSTKASLIRQRIIGFVVFCTAVLAADQLSKAWARNHLVDHSDYIGSTEVGFSLTTNSGSAFSLFQDSTIYLTIVAIIVSAILIVLFFRTKNTWMAYCYLAIAVGALGNVIDRFTQPPYGGHGHVSDFIRIGMWPTFNIADSLITIGAIALVVETFFRKGDETAAPSEDSQ